MSDEDKVLMQTVARVIISDTAGSGAVQYAAGVGQTPVWVTAEALAALAQRPLPLG